MKKELISNIKKYVNYLLIPLEDMYYHHYEHALSVMERSLYLATMEGCSEDEIEILVIAALFHDTGFVIQYDNNEIFGAKIAKNYLRTILYPDEKIKIIQNIILATTPGKEPKTFLEKIIKDADMDNL
jgi:HD superfamily phosphodiesterase